MMPWHSSVCTFELAPASTFAVFSCVGCAAHECRDPVRRCGERCRRNQIVESLRPVCSCQTCVWVWFCLADRAVAEFVGPIAQSLARDRCGPTPLLKVEGLRTTFCISGHTRMYVCEHVACAVSVSSAYPHCRTHQGRAASKRAADQALSQVRNCRAQAGPAQQFQQ
eukprot:732687-Alexandrium_andersonii.AAC.1